MQKFCLKIALLAFIGFRLNEAAGYNYQEPFVGAALPLNYNGQLRNPYGVPAQGLYTAPLTETNAIPAQSPYGFPAQSNYGATPVVPEPLDSGWNKEFYSYEAPVDLYEDTQGLQKISAALQKNLRVIFIKTPENRGLQQAALALAKQTTEDRTSIYVLNKQNDLSDLANRLNTFREHRTHKPEVHFIKYKTPEEAVQAQQYIRAQYDTIQGVTTQNSNEGVAPVLNFASSNYNAAGQSSANNYYGPYDTSDKGLSGSLGGPIDNRGSNNNKSGDISANSASLSSHSAQTSDFNYNYNHPNYGNGIDFGYGNGFGDGYAKIGIASSNEPAFKTNERHSKGSKFVFPSDSGPSNAYLPPL